MWSVKLSFKFPSTWAKPKFQAIAHFNICSHLFWFPQICSSAFQIALVVVAFIWPLPRLLSHYYLLSLHRYCTTRLPLVLSPGLDCRPLVTRGCPQASFLPNSAKRAEDLTCHGSQLWLEGGAVVKLESEGRCVPTRFPEPWLSDLLNYSLKVSKYE